MSETYEQQYIFDNPEEQALELNLANFSGPLDLLLSLVKENKIEIKDIFVSQVTEQFLSYMTQLSDLDVDKASEYMAMAATLLEIKSRALLPVEEADSDPETPEKVLIRQLEEYKIFKEVLGELKECENVNRFYREPDESVGAEVTVIKEKLNADEFMKVFGKLLLRIQERSETTNVSRAIAKENFSVPQKIEYLREKVEYEKKFLFFGMFNESTSHNELITTFLAVLEMLKLQLILVKQNELFDDFWIEQNPNAPKDVVVADTEEDL